MRIESAAMLWAMGCVAQPAPVAAPVVVAIPAPEEEPLPEIGYGAQAAASAAAVAEPQACPPGSSREGAQCVRVVASPEIPAWTPPSGHLDPCATWTSGRGLVECDPNNEHAKAARDAGAARGR